MPEPLVSIVQLIPRSFWEEPALHPMPPFEGAELIIDGVAPTDPILNDLNPDVFAQLVFLHQEVDDAFGRRERVFVYHLRPGA